VSDREALRGLVAAAAASLERSRQRIDDLNVYPVPDGDTGTNLVLTVRGIVEALERSPARDRAELAREATHAALMSARGNSGVILSQIVRGAAEALGDAGTADAPAIARAVRAASDEAYRAVRNAVEGTMLTVVRELAEEAESSGANTPAALLAALVRRGEEAVARTPGQLAVLREAGVVDAGGAGLLELVRGLAAAVAGEALPEAPPPEVVPVEAVHQEPSRYRYCTLFVIEGEQLDPERLETELDRLGDSVLVVGDASAVKVHVHTDDPDAALALGAAGGVVVGVEIADMHLQTERRERRLRAGVREVAASSVVAVAVGEGNRRLFESLGVEKIIAGGPTMNPPAAELVAAVEALDAAAVVLLPNSADVVLAAEQAARLANKPVHVVASESIPAGLAAAVAFNPERPAAENAALMRGAAAAVVTADVAVAVRDATIGGVSARKGDYLGRADGTAIAAGRSLEEVARALLERVLAEPREVVTLLTGDDAPSLDGLLEELAERHPEVDFEVHEGGQPHYPLLVSAE
jgi:DAK2 domain fusion protein YloV